LSSQLDLDFKPKKIFENRAQATIELMDTLPKEEFKSSEWVVLAISDGAVPFASSIARKFGLYFDLVFTEAIYAPSNAECVIARVSETEDIVMHTQLVDVFAISLDYIYNEANRKHEEKILKRIYKYRKGEHLSALKGKNVLLVDEGCETGLTVLCALKTVINRSVKSVYFATPLIATDVVNDIQTVCDDVFCVKQLENFVQTDHYYDSLPTLAPESVYAILEISKEYLPFVKKRGENI
jgi:putative phosphoribosyl transferase